MGTLSLKSLAIGALLLLTSQAILASATPEVRLEQILAAEETDSAGTRAALQRLLPQLSPGAARAKAQAKLCILTAIVDAKASLPIAAQGLAEARARGDRTTESKMQRCEGYAQESLGETAAAAHSYSAAVIAAELSGDKEAMAEALVSRGELRHFVGNYGEAIDDLKRSYDLSAALKLDSNTSYALNAMANLYADANVGEYDKAIAYYRELLARHVQAGRRGEVATAHFNLGSTLERKGDLDAALPEYLRAYEIDQARNDAASVAEEQRVIGALLAKQGKPAQALPRIEEAMAYFKRTDDADGVARVRLTRGIALRAVGRYEDALKDLDAARAYFRAEQNQRFLARIAEERAQALEALARWREAYAALGEQFKAQREIDRKLAEERTARLRVQFGAEQTERQNALLQLENQRRGEALRAAERERRLQWQVIVLGIALLALLAGLALRQLRRARRLRTLALTDELTGLPNRRNILTFLGEHAHAAHRSGAALSVISFDIDHFKSINDTHGHDGGDRALKHLAMAAGGALRGSDRIGRVGGEEFLVVLPATERTTAIEIAERMRKTIEATSFDVVSPGLHISISLGVGTYSTDVHEPVDALIKRADEALYRAKEHGRNRVEVDNVAASESS